MYQSIQANFMVFKVTFLSDHSLQHTHDANINLGLLLREYSEAFEDSTSNFGFLGRYFRSFHSNIKCFLNVWIFA